MKVAVPILQSAAILLLAPSCSEHGSVHAFSMNAGVSSAATTTTTTATTSLSTPMSRYQCPMNAVFSPQDKSVVSSRTSSFCFNDQDRSTPAAEQGGTCTTSAMNMVLPHDYTTSQHSIAAVKSTSRETSSGGMWRNLIQRKESHEELGVDRQKGNVARHVKKVLKSAFVALAWYFASATLAGAAEAVSGMSGVAGGGAGRTVSAMKRSDAKKHAAGLRIGTILCLYVLSSKNIKRRNSFDGVVPRDEESRQILTQDAKEHAMSYGRPAGRVALFGVDFIIASLSFLYIRNALQTAGAFVTPGVGPWNPLFWNQNILSAATFSAFCTLAVRLIGQGYIRYSLGVWLAPMALTVVVKPVQRLVSFAWGIGQDWDLGPTPEERFRINEGKMTSQQLRESLSTFKDPTVEFREQDPHYHADGDYYDDEVDDDGFGNNGQAPPDLRRSS